MPVIGNKRISKLTKADLQSVIDRAYSERRLSEKTLSNVRGFLMSFLKYCRSLNATNLFVEDLSIPRGAKKSTKDIIHPEEIPVLFSTQILPGAEKRLSIFIYMPIALQF